MSDHTRNWRWRRNSFPNKEFKFNFIYGCEKWILRIHLVCFFLLKTNMKNSEFTSRRPTTILAFEQSYKTRELCIWIFIARNQMRIFLHIRANLHAWSVSQLTKYIQTYGSTLHIHIMYMVYHYSLHTLAVSSVSSYMYVELLPYLHVHT